MSSQRGGGGGAGRGSFAGGAGGAAICGSGFFSSMFVSSMHETSMNHRAIRRIAAIWPFWSSLVADEGLVQIGDQVGGVFEADCEA
jgi:hypothetical protein